MMDLCFIYCYMPTLKIPLIPPKILQTVCSQSPTRFFCSTVSTNGTHSENRFFHIQMFVQNTLYTFVFGYF